MIHVDVLAALEAFTKIGTFGGEEICQDYIGKAEVAGVYVHGKRNDVYIPEKTY
jgi:hypothetical protein